MTSAELLSVLHIVSSMVMVFESCLSMNFWCIFHTQTIWIGCQKKIQRCSAACLQWTQKSSTEPCRCLFSGPSTRTTGYVIYLPLATQSIHYVWLRLNICGCSEDTCYPDSYIVLPHDYSDFESHSRPQRKFFEWLIIWLSMVHISQRGPSKCEQF